MSLALPDTAQLRKARGAFFTPEVVARYVTQWAIRSAADVVLEPSCGEAAFLVAAGLRLRDLGAEGLAGQLHGAEIHHASAEQALRSLRAHGMHADIDVGDFLRCEPTQEFDAVVGNPPYVRYQDFSGESRAAAKRAAMRAGVALTSLASSWAAFTVHSTMFVRPGGRLGLVLPAEMLSVNYAGPVRDFLMREFSRVRLVLFTERVFPGVMEDVVLLLAEGRSEGPTDHCELVHARNGAALLGLRESDVRRWTPAAEGRWSSALLGAEATDAYATLLSLHEFGVLEDWGDTTLGMVTGRNDFFALSTADVQDHRLSASDVVRLSPPGSRHLRGLSLTRPALDRLSAAGRRTWLFRPPADPSPAAQRYIGIGESAGVHTAYKCRVRSPWWRVPYLPPADVLLTYMNADTARLCANVAGAHHLNSVHGVYLRPDVRSVGRDLLPLAALNSLTLLGAELVGRSYGGGVLKLEPREADRWPMPSPALVRDRAEQLRRVRRRVRDLLSVGRVFDAAQVVDHALLGHGSDLDLLERVRLGRRALHDRRMDRSRSG